MTASLKIKRSETSGNPSILGAGEIAYSSLVDNGSNGGDRLYIGTGTETNGNAVNHAVIGGKYFTDIINAAASVNTADTLVKRNSSGAAYLDIFGNVVATDVTVSSLTDMRVVFSDTNGKLVDNAGLTFNAFGQLSVPQIIVDGGSSLDLICLKYTSQFFFLHLLHSYRQKSATESMWRFRDPRPMRRLC